MDNERYDTIQLVDILEPNVILTLRHSQFLGRWSTSMKYSNLHAI